MWQTFRVACPNIPDDYKSFQEAPAGFAPTPVTESYRDNTDTTLGDRSASVRCYRKLGLVSRPRPGGANIQANDSGKNHYERIYLIFRYYRN
jgi:hypothetical protein